MRYTLVIALLGFSLYGLAQDSWSFALLRQDDGYKDFPVDTAGGFYSSIKQTRIGESSYLSFGGSYRGQFEHFRNEDFTANEGQDNGWYLQRFLFHTHAQLGHNFRFFGELGTSTIYEKEKRSPVDKDELYANQFFVAYEKTN